MSRNKVTIDLDNETIEIHDDDSIDDILESSGVLTPEQAKELMEEVKKCVRKIGACEHSGV